MVFWLANSDFASNALSTIFGHGNIIDKPTVYLMRPYRKDLRTIILIHGLASSPEAWVNTANEIMGDKLLRDITRFGRSTIRQTFRS